MWTMQPFVAFDQEDKSTIVPIGYWKDRRHNMNKNEEVYILWLDEEVDTFRKEQNLDIHWKSQFPTTTLIDMVKNLDIFNFLKYFFRLNRRK